ncbi:nuclear transport factor 2 family protein [Hypericibacter sp.]|uniref:nuclear transport factor 2 family protein n=1 Tax=Hypericibacter sp. TaxID=2705401 RepID=UPI003D6CDB2F
MCGIMAVDPVQYGAHWVAAWNRRDIDAILADYAEDAVFVSPRALAITGCAELHGKPALASYWRRASAAIASLHFSLDRSVWDPECRALAVLYRAEIDGQRLYAAEFIELDEAGLIRRGEAIYGTSPSPG